MARYLLNCECGRALSVDAGRAGEQIVCQCGAVLDVPPLRKLRHLPVESHATEGVGPSWNTRRGIIAACLIAAAGLGLWALWSRLTEPSIAPFDPAVREHLIEHSLETMTPRQTWELWVDRYRPMAQHGFTELQHPQAAAVDEEVAERRFLQKTLLAVAGVFVTVAVAAVLWPRPTTRGQGDKETRRR